MEALIPDPMNMMAWCDSQLCRCGHAMREHHTEEGTGMIQRIIIHNCKQCGVAQCPFFVRQEDKRIVAQHIQFNAKHTKASIMNGIYKDGQVQLNEENFYFITGKDLL